MYSEICVISLVQVALIAWQVIWSTSLAQDGAKEQLQRWHSTLQLRLLQRSARSASQRAALLLLAFQRKQQLLEALLQRDSFAMQKDLSYRYSDGRVTACLMEIEVPHGGVT